MPSLAVHWVKNNVLAAIVFALASLSIYGVRSATGAAGADAGLAAAAILSLSVVALWAFAGAANGVLSGAVLQRVLPMLPVWNWIALQVAIAIVLSLGVAVNYLVAPGEPPRADDLPIGATLLWGFIAGGFLGALVGGLEALVLRKVALGTGNWIVWSAAAHALGWSLVAGGGKLWNLGQDFSGELAATALWLLVAALNAVVMLPALQGLRSRVLSAAGQHFT